MRILRTAGAFGLVFGFFLAGCGVSNPVVATIGGDQLLQRDFEDTYAKNNGGWEAATKSTLEDRQRFLDLLVKFRLKVKEANARALLQDSSIQEELHGYEGSVAQTYMVDKELVEPGVRTMYERKRESIRVSHILLRVAENASPEDTLKMWTRAVEIINLAGSSPFDSLAARLSEDQSVSFNKGDLGFFSAGRMVPAFEDAAFALSPGQVSPVPVRTQFGYHVIKLSSRQANKGAVQISHLLLRYADPTDTVSVRDTLASILRQLGSGTPYDQLVPVYSQDEGTRMNGGDIGLYDRDRLPPDLADLLYETPVGSVTKPYFAPYGVHIFRVRGFAGVPAYSAVERELRQSYQQMRYQKDFERYVQSLKVKYGVSPDPDVLSALNAMLDSTMTAADSLWSRRASMQAGGRAVLRADGISLTVDSLLARIGASPEFATQRLTPASIASIVGRISDSFALETHARKAAERHPAFGKLMNEYRDGILLYRIEQDEVWQKVTVNDSLLRVYWEPRKEEYRWPERTNFAEIYVTSDSLAKAASKRIAAKQDFLNVAEQMTMRAGFREKKGVWGFQTRTANDLATRAFGMAVDSVDGPFAYGAGFSIIKVLAKDSARTKTFDEAIPEVTGGFQEHASKEREASWVNELRNKYGVVTDVEALRSAFVRKPDAIE